jgi:hypothetical protein
VSQGPRNPPPLWLILLVALGLVLLVAYVAFPSWIGCCPGPKL